MPRLSHAQEAARQQIAQLARETLLPEQLSKRLLAALQLAIPADRQALFGVDPGSLLFNRLLAVNTGNLDATLFWLKNIYLVREPTPEITFPSLMGSNTRQLVIHDRVETSYGLPPQLLARLTPQQYYSAYHDIGTPAGGILSSAFAVGTEWVAACALLRWDPSQPFRPGDVEFLRLVGPVIGRALRSAFDYERAICSSHLAGPDYTGVFLLSPDGRVQFSTPAAEMWSDLLRRMELAKEGVLPTAVLAAVARLNAGREAQPLAQVRIPTPRGTVRIEASVGNDGRSIGVVLAPEPGIPPAKVPPAWPLTSRERQIVELLVSGLSYRQIAARLVVTENTVQTHLRHTYEKLGVSGRNQLLASLFGEVYSPSLNGPREG
jgi:DNA-binding CsgD family transcriptional regulator